MAINSSLIHDGFSGPLIFPRSVRFGCQNELREKNFWISELLLTKSVVTLLTKNQYITIYF